MDVTHCVEHNGDSVVLHITDAWYEEGFAGSRHEPGYESDAGPEEGFVELDCIDCPAKRIADATYTKCGVFDILCEKHADDIAIKLVEHIEASARDAVDSMADAQYEAQKDAQYERRYTH